MRAADFPEPDARRIARDRRRPRPRSPPLPSLARLADAARSLVLHNAVAGEDIVTEGDDADDWIILLDSGASVFKGTGKATMGTHGEVTHEEKFLAELRRFDCLGEAAIIDEEPRSSSVRVHDDCHYATLCAADYRSLMLSGERRAAEEKVSKLRKVAVFGSLARKELRALSAFFYDHHADGGHLVIEQGQ